MSVRFERGRWFAAFTVEQNITRPAPASPGAVAGIDLGIKTLAVLSTGEEIPNPRHLGKSLRKCATCPARRPGAAVRTAAPASDHQIDGDARRPRWQRLRAGSPTSGGTPCIRQRPT